MIIILKPNDIEKVKKVLVRDERVVFGYIYGSFGKSEDPGDLDIAIYSVEKCDEFILSSDLKIELSENTELPPEYFDIRIINGLPETGDLFSLLYLKSVFDGDYLLFDKDISKRTDFIEKFSMKYRECEGLFAEVLV